MQYLGFPMGGGGPAGTAITFLLNVVQVLLLARVVVTWLVPKSTHPIVTLLELLTEPIVKPLRQVVSPIGNIDLPAICAFVIADIVKVLLGFNGMLF